jgi:alkylation response protein AidB-like acyl-CoA dehydrogenase
MRDLAEAGVLGVAASQDVGGLGMGLSAAGVIAEEIGRVLAPEPVTATIGLGVGLLQRLCPDSEMLGKVMAGEIAVAVAWQERGPRGASEMECRHGERQGDRGQGLDRRGGQGRHAAGRGDGREGAGARRRGARQ